MNDARPIGRIDDILDGLRVVWRAYPDMRLGQLLCAASDVIRGDMDPFYLEDEHFLAWMLQGALFPKAGV